MARCSRSSLVPVCARAGAIVFAGGAERGVVGAEAAAPIARALASEQARTAAHGGER